MARGERRKEGGAAAKRSEDGVGVYREIEREGSI
jgi:hypothetical protein